jgi:hypothetical protein
MSSERHIDRKCGTNDARQELALLREKWPVAFPAETKSIRPLAIGAAGEIASAMGWSLPYTLGVLARWKMDARTPAPPSPAVAHAAKGVVGWMHVPHVAVNADHRNETS